MLGRGNADHYPASLGFPCHRPSSDRSVRNAGDSQGTVYWPFGKYRLVSRSAALTDASNERDEFLLLIKRYLDEATSFTTEGNGRGFLRAHNNPWTVTTCSLTKTWQVVWTFFAVTGILTSSSMKRGFITEKWFSLVRSSWDSSEACWIDLQTLSNYANGLKVRWSRFSNFSGRLHSTARAARSPKVPLPSRLYLRHLVDVGCDYTLEIPEGPAGANLADCSHSGMAKPWRGRTVF